MVAIIPMAGKGTRYTQHGFSTPKPLIEVAGKPMVLWALKSIEHIVFRKIIIVGLREHEDRLNLAALVTKHLSGRVEFLWLDDVTEGQLCTVLAAKHLLDPEEDVLICASDTFVESDIGKDSKKPGVHGLISVINLPGEQWSFARTDISGNVVEVAEKKRISDNASTGLYYFRKAKDLIFFGEAIIRNNEKTRGEYYVIPVYQKMIEAGKRVAVSHARAMWDMGTPEAKEYFETRYFR
jgi:dTDP-glucose pyrophosphorylase